MTNDPDVKARMRRDWNERAAEDAHFYVAFGRRGQNAEEFFDTATEVVRGLEWEMRRLPKAANRRARRALEIGCGPGRLMKPMSPHFGEIHGVDVSDEMIGRAKEYLAGIPHGHVHATSGADLAPFADESFDFVYSYAVFQHIPSVDVVFEYLREAHRVMKTGAVFRAQFNGLPQTATQYDTWSGVRISGDQLRDFTRQYNFQLFALEGVSTQYMWTTWRKREPGWWKGVPAGATRIRRITNAHSAEPVAPPKGRFASVTLWMENLPANLDLNHLSVRMGGLDAFACYIGPPENDGAQQLNVMIPPDLPTGLHPVRLLWNGFLLCPERAVRIIPSGPMVPRLISATDGINLLSGSRIVSGVVKVVMEEVERPDEFSASIGGRPVRNLDIFCADPLPPRYEINFHVDEEVTAGPQVLTMTLGRRSLPPVPLEIVRDVPAASAAAPAPVMNGDVS